MIDGIITPTLRDIDYLAPAAPYPVIPSGITVHQKPIYRYSIPTDEQPTLIIVDYIPDHNGNFIKPGHYQLALSDDKEFLYLIESKDLIAIIPVFKIDENKSELNKLYASKKELTKEQKKARNKKKRQVILAFSFGRKLINLLLLKQDPLLLHSRTCLCLTKADCPYK